MGLSVLRGVCRKRQTVGTITYNRIVGNKVLLKRNDVKVCDETEIQALL